MKQLILYGILICNSICAMEEYNAIKALVGKASDLATYLESRDQYLHTPLMRFFDKASDEQVQEILELLKNCSFNKEIEESSGETAFFFACDRPSIIAASLMIGLGANINVTGKNGRPIYLSFLNGNPALLNLLIEEGANPKIPADIIAAVHAAQRPNLEILKQAPIILERIP